MNKTKVENSIKRPPVVVIMGHIDHGKSTLLDYIRKSNIVEHEAGGITQHLGAYEVKHKSSEGNEGKITFLDTPGHEAFCSIRERGAHVADVAILVVSAEDGVKPQTMEALKCILDEKIPFVVAINKIDKPGADIDRTKQSLAENEIYVEGYGGDIPVAPISALKGEGVSELLDLVLLVTDLQDFKGNPNIPAQGSVIEAKLDNKKGVSATLLIKDGTLESGQYVVAGDAISPVRIFEDYQGKPIKSATFSSPVKVIGFDKLPIVGEIFSTCNSKKEAEAKANEFLLLSKQRTKNKSIEKSENNTDLVLVPIIIKADAVGSLDGIKHELAKIKNSKVKIKIVSEGIGSINENDVKLAQSDQNIVVLGFNVKTDAKATHIIEHSSINLKNFDIIYNLIQYIKDTVISKVPKEYIDEVSGIAKVMAVFSKNKDKQIIGGKVQSGTLLLGSDVKIFRRDAEIGRGKIKEIQSQKVKVDEINEGYEFGCMIESKIEIALGDKIQGFKTIEKI